MSARTSQARVWRKSTAFSWAAGIIYVIASFGLVLDIIGFVLFPIFVLASSIMCLRRQTAVANTAVVTPHPHVTWELLRSHRSWTPASVAAASATAACAAATLATGTRYGEQDT